MSFSVKISGLESIVAKIQKKSDEMEKKVQAELKQFGIDARAEAVARAPVDESKLRGSINFKEERLKVSLIVAVYYGAFIEFGTRKRTDIPAGWEQFAAQFKGAAGRGNYKDFVQAIYEWVKRKGITNRYSVKTRKAIRIKQGSEDDDRARQAAYAIAYSIIRNGIKPHPFFIPAVNHARVALENRLKNIKL